MIFVKGQRQRTWAQADFRSDSSRFATVASRGGTAVARKPSGEFGSDGRVGEGCALG